MRVALELPDEFLSDLIPDGRDPARVLLEEAVASAYRSHRLTMEQVRILLGFGTRVEVDAFLGARNIFDYTSDDFRDDLQTLARLEQAHVHQDAA